MAVTEFRELSEPELGQLTDDRLIDYIRAAREAGRREAMGRAIAILVMGYWDTLVQRARLKVPESEVEDVVAETMISAIGSAFDGRTVGEFRSWMHTILSRRIADLFESRKRRPATTELAGEHGGDEEVWGKEPEAPFEGDALFAQDCLRRAYDELEEERHRQVIDLYLLGPRSASETAAEVGRGMTAANVHQISSRFQSRFRALLEEGDPPG
jgi:RNA polymerase sigma factor (sigma-70 family)